MPVRVAIESVPDGIPLVAGTTATVTVRAPGIEGDGFRWSLAALGVNLRTLFGGQRLPADAVQTTRSEGA